MAFPSDFVTFGKFVGNFRNMSNVNFQFGNFFYVFKH